MSYPIRNGKAAHRTAAETKLGRPLQKDEDVHHRDDDKKNFNPTNLDVMKHGDHSKMTSSKERKTYAKLQDSLRMVREKRKLY